MCHEGVHAIIVELLLHCCSEQPTSIMLLHTLASSVKQSPLYLLRHADSIHRLLQLHSLAAQLIRVGRDSLLDHASHISSTRESAKRSHLAAFNSDHCDLGEPYHASALHGMQQLLHRIKWDAAVESGHTSKRIMDSPSPSETSYLDLLLLGSNMRFNPPNVTHQLTPELWSHIPDSCVLSCTELANRCESVLPSHSLHLPLEFCRFASKVLIGLHSGWSFEYIMLGSGLCAKDTNNDGEDWPSVYVFLSQQLRSTELIEAFIQHMCLLFVAQQSPMALTPLVFVSFLIILDAGLSAAMSQQAIVNNLCGCPLPPFPCPSITAHAEHLGPISKRARAKLWASFGASASDNLARALASACHRFNATGLSSCLRECKADAAGLVASGVIRASVVIFGRNSRLEHAFACSDYEFSRGRWTSVLVTLHSMGLVSIERLMQCLPDNQPLPTNITISGGLTSSTQNLHCLRSLSHCISPTHLSTHTDDSFPLIYAFPSHSQSKVSNCHPLSKTPTSASQYHTLTQSSQVSSLACMKRDLMVYISWRVQFALLPPSCETLRQSLSDLTSEYVLQAATAHILSFIDSLFARVTFCLG